MKPKDCTSERVDLVWHTCQCQFCSAAPLVKRNLITLHDPTRTYIWIHNGNLYRHMRTHTNRPTHIHHTHSHTRSKVPAKRALQHRLLFLYCFLIVLEENRPCAQLKMSCSARTCASLRVLARMLCSTSAHTTQKAKLSAELNTR